MGELVCRRGLLILSVLAVASSSALWAMEVEWCFTDQCGGCCDPPAIVTTNLPDPDDLTFSFDFRLEEPADLTGADRVTFLQVRDANGNLVFEMAASDVAGDDKLGVRYQISPGVFGQIYLGELASVTSLTVTRERSASNGQITVDMNGNEYTTGWVPMAGTPDKIGQDVFVPGTNVLVHMFMTPVMLE